VKTTTWLASAVFGLCFGALAASAQDVSPQPQIDVVVTSGEAVIKIAPDRAFVSIAVESRARAPRDAQQQNAQTMTAVQQKLRSAGIPEDAVRTIAVELSPEFDFNNGRQQLRGYVARNGVEIRVDAIDKLGDVIDAAVNTGATNVTGVRFDSRQREDREREALSQAVAQARARAAAAAAGAGRTVDRVIRVEDRGAGPVPPPHPVMMAARMEKADVSTPIAPGELEIRAAVTLTAALK
jgi:uncharacterized protein YggE